MLLKDYLIDNGFFEDADEVLRAVIAGDVLVDDVRVSSASLKIAPYANVRVKSRKEFVSRGGDKLKAAIKDFSINVAGKSCLDIGSSTGGFTDCLLQQGAAQVTCVDVNYGQLAWEIRTNERVSVFERTNIRKVECAEIGGPFDLIVIDVSFIGLAALAKDIARFSKQGTELLALVKPQFESQRGETQGGVVQDEQVRLRTVAEVECAMRDVGFQICGTVESPLKGKSSGNTEYLMYAIFNHMPACSANHS